jgi:hypothetical protein
MKSSSLIEHHHPSGMDTIDRSAAMNVRSSGGCADRA